MSNVLSVKEVIDEDGKIYDAKALIESFDVTIQHPKSHKIGI